MKPLLSLCACAALLWSAAGCSSSFREHHYFATKGERADGRKTHYYRVSVTGRADFASSRYMSGYFDPRAVEAYFGEFSPGSQDGHKQDFGVESDPAADDDSSSPRQAESVDPKNKGRQLVFLLSSNAEAIASQIGNIAQSEDLAASIATLMAGEDIRRAFESRTRLETLNEDAKLVASLGTNLLQPLDDADSASKINATLLLYANQIARRLGAPRDFDSLEQARAWTSAARATNPGAAQ